MAFLFGHLARASLAIVSACMSFLLSIVLTCRKKQSAKRLASQGQPTVRVQSPHVFIDGANVAWSDGGGAPRSRCILSAMKYFRTLGASSTVVMPRSMVVCEQKRRLCDAHAARQCAIKLKQFGNRVPENAPLDEVMFSMHGAMWRHNVLWREHERGNVVLVDRVRACDDDLATISLARSSGPLAWLCSNDKYRDHTRQRPNRPRSELSLWLKQRRIEYSFGGTDAEFQANFTTPLQRRLFLSAVTTRPKPT